jgi:N6-adenosine-specific RNA methylase IME4
MRTLTPGRTQTNIIVKQKREHSRKPDEQYPIIEACSPGPYLEMFARATRDGWHQWGNETDKNGAVEDIDVSSQLRLVMEKRLQLQYGAVAPDEA